MATRNASRRKCSPLGCERLEERMLLSGGADFSVARQWNEALLDAIRVDTPRPTVHARNLFHASVAMYDAWAAYQPRAKAYLEQDAAVLNRARCRGRVDSCMSEAVSFAAYRVLTARYGNSPGAATSLAAFDALMDQLGYDTSNTNTVGRTPAAIGNRIAEAVLEYGLTDGSNEANGFADTTGYQPANDPLDMTQSGADLNDPNRWQPLVVSGKTQQFLTPHWGDVTPFAMKRESADQVYYDPGPPPLLGGPGDAEFKDAILSVISYSASLDPDNTEIIDISPASRGNNPLGTDDGAGHRFNPYTRAPYEPNLVTEGDWGRVLAEFWADGPKSETPPGHWNTIANAVSDSLPDSMKRLGGRGKKLSDLEWDVKLYFILNGAVHDAAIAAWDVKEAYDYVRPISMIRYIGGLGQSSDPSGQSYHPHGLPLEPGLVELITSQTTAAGERHEHLAGHEGELAIRAWAGHPADPTQYGGTAWILAEDWKPYQAVDFVTPPFAAYVSGHSTFSRAAAEVLTRFTGSAYFPGGLGTFIADAGSLKFESGPTREIALQWATYYDAADEAGLSRIYGGIHVAADDYAGRVLGSKIGIKAFDHAVKYFARGLRVRR